jgi:hypothetical protein
MNSGLLKQATLLKIALRTNGVDVQCSIDGVGKNIKEDIRGLYKIDKVDSLRPNELNLYGNITTKLVFNKDSPFKLIREGVEYFIVRDKKTLMQVTFNKRPSFYGRLTKRNTPMENVAQVMGRDCLAIAVDKRCQYFTNGDFCRYCNCTPTNVESGLERIAQDEDVHELVSIFGDQYRFIDLTGGTFADRDEECKRYTKLGNIIQNALGRKFSGPFSLSPPKDLDLLQKLHETGVDVISFNPDVWDDKQFAIICPGKNKIGKAHYDSALKVAKDLWGRGNAVVQFLIGPWESRTSLLEGVKYHMDKGILVNLTTFCPSPQSSLQGLKQIPLKEIIEIYLSYGELIKEYDFYPNKRKSILTSESGNRSSISNEVVKGFLTKDNYDPAIDIKYLGESQR